ncbi:MAG: Ig-like domain-containing protein [Xanthomonadales bacterium]|nr:hypothetical protein [Xanthomonadales bacterium]MCC6594339.1 Ig-like domain-containing protein [Xanthomonadales bacterium]MCE7931386.1 hypothetical protein [Xanthomonadales bacterium PRO6]
MSVSRLFLASALAIAASGAHAAVFINEIHYDDVDADIGEAIEVVATAGESLADYDIVRYNGGNGGTPYGTDAVPAGDNVNCGVTVRLGVIHYPMDGLQNGAQDGVALVLRSSSTVIQFLSWEGTLTAAGGPANGMTSVDIGVAESNTTPEGTSLQLGGGPGSAYTDFNWNGTASANFSACNNGQTFGAPVDNPPTVSSTVPANTATGVAADANLSVQFSEAVTTNAGWFALSCATSGTVTVNETGTGASRSLDPVPLLAPGELCTASITAANVIDQDGTPDPMAANFQWAFTVAADAVPTVASTAPTNNAINVAPTANLTVQFSEAVTTNVGWFDLDCAVSGNNLAVNESGTGSSRTLDPVAPLAFGEQCTANITAANVIDLDGTPHPMAANFSWSFTVLPDNPPTVTSTAPANGVANVPVGANLLVGFSEAVTPSGSWFTIACANSGAHTAQVSGGPQNYTLNPDVNFDLLESCTVTLIAAQIVDQDGTPHPLPANHVWSFTTAASSANYYASVDASTPALLRSTLHLLIDDHTAYRYSIGTNTCNVGSPNTTDCDVWDILEAAEQDPGNPNRVLDVYRNRSYAKITDRSGATGPNTYNREHTWPNSLGFNGLSGVDANNHPYSPYVDGHMLYASASDYNANRGNKPYDNCNAGCTENVTDANHGFGGGSGVYPGNSNWVQGSDGNTGTYEVWNHRKGDMARAILYMDIRYEGGTHVNGQPEPDLIVTNNRSLIQTTPNNQVPAQGYMGVLDTLLQWHFADPPDAQEILRNEVVFLFQGNRNPFIDHPEWVACLWQGTCTPGDTIFDNGFEGN